MNLWFYRGYTEEQINDEFKRAMEDRD